MDSCVWPKTSNIGCLNENSESRLSLRAMPSAWQGGNERRSNPHGIYGNVLVVPVPCDARGVARNDREVIVIKLSVQGLLIKMATDNEVA